jgi:hypothetical protein
MEPGVEKLREQPDLRTELQMPPQPSTELQNKDAQ